MNRHLFTLLTLVLLFTLTGCKEPDFKAENRALTDRVNILSEENLELISRVEAIETKLEYFSAENERLEAERNALAIELKTLKSKASSRKRRRR